MYLFYNANRSTQWISLDCTGSSFRQLELICNQQVVGSNPSASSIKISRQIPGDDPGRIDIDGWSQPASGGGQAPCRPGRLSAGPSRSPASAESTNSQPVRRTAARTSAASRRLCSGAGKTNDDIDITSTPVSSVSRKSRPPRAGPCAQKGARPRSRGVAQAKAGLEIER